MKIKPLFIILLLIAASCKPTRYSATYTTNEMDARVKTITEIKLITPPIINTPISMMTNTSLAFTNTIIKKDQSTLPYFATINSKFPKLITPLSPEEKETILFEMNTLEGCDLPCWWKIQLDTTTWDEVKILLIKYFDLSMDYEKYTLDSGKTISWYTIYQYIQNDYIDNKLFIYEDNNKIYYIRMYAEFADTIEWNDREKSSYELRTKWKLLAPEKIITLFGDPTRVYYISEGPIGNEGSYSVPYHQLFLFYDEFGLAIEYSGWHKNEINNRCIGFRSTNNYPDSIRIFIKSLSVNNPMEEMHNISFWDGFPTLKESTGMEISEFTSKLVNPANNGCI